MTRFPETKKQKKIHHFHKKKKKQKKNQIMESNDRIYSDLNNYISLNYISEVKDVIEIYPNNLNILHDDGIFFSLAISNKNIEILEILLNYFHKTELEKHMHTDIKSFVKIQNKKKLLDILQNAVETYGSSEELDKFLNQYHDKSAKNSLTTDTKVNIMNMTNFSSMSQLQDQHDSKVKRERQGLQEKTDIRIDLKKEKKVTKTKRVIELIFLPYHLIKFCQKPTTVVQTLLMGQYKGTFNELEYIDNKLMVVSLPFIIHTIEIGATFLPVDVSPMLNVTHLQVKDIKYFVRQQRKNFQNCNLVTDKTSTGLFFSIRRLCSASQYTNEKNFLLFQIWNKDQFPPEKKDLDMKSTELLFGISDRVKHSFLFSIITNNGTGELEMQCEELTKKEKLVSEI